ncbi:metabolite traffic protein EboE [Haloferula helveola]|uniref:Metabolite traffic protein EboE n=1 Tax=Haloferula helveola TaxID=490095 RepID=A0ABM7RB94_9BACT|nr:metabolite traffic protein EboE [Haloferula helveola]
MKFPCGHLAYCTNIHPAESWEETLGALTLHTLRVRDLVAADGNPFAIGLRLSARAAAELLQGDRLARFKDWLAEENAYVFTINGFPYGDFHGTRVKEKVYQPDWTSPARVEYTKELFTIISELAPKSAGGSVSTLPGSFKAFGADESVIRENLIELADFIDALSEVSGTDLHLGLEPEPLGHFENTEETLRFFDRLLDDAQDHEKVKRRIGINYDCCHFALEYEDTRSSLEVLRREGLRISKIHLSAALALDPRGYAAIDTAARFDEPTYLHQVIERHPDGRILRYTDLPDAIAAYGPDNDAEQWRVHFHIPLDHDPEEPLKSTRVQASDTLKLCLDDPEMCTHFEIETYTWGVLPPEMQRPVEEQIAGEYRWVRERTGD